MFPAAGFEIYGEWARYRLPLSLRDLLEQPGHTQGYTMGAQWALETPADALWRLRLETTNLERSGSYRLRPIGSYYSSPTLQHGYTHRGKVLGAAIGPGSSSQWLQADYLRHGARVGAFISRTRWHNDAYYRRVTPWPVFGHDVTLEGGVRGGVDVVGMRLDAEYALGKRHNFLFQNFGAGWAEMDNAVDIINHTFRLTFTALPVRL